ncbi:MAG: hypothetical protein WCT99_00985 [Bacteroidota bacterium]
MKKYFILLLFCAVPVFSQLKKIDFRTTDPKGLSASEMIEYNRSRTDFFQSFKKTSGLRSEIKSVVIQGNKIKTIIYNTGSISRPGISANVLDLVWDGLGYGYEFGPLVGAKVLKAGSLVDSIKIVSEGFDSPTDGEYGPDGSKWGWLPKPGYSAPGQSDVASWGARSKVNNDLKNRPPSWPESWYNSGLNQYVYPSFLGGNSTVPDEEVYYVVDDYTKKEFEYYPFPNDSSKRGLGINLEVRTFQFANPLAEDIIFLVYTAENSSPTNLPQVYFGMFGDPHIGGANNFADDAAKFIPAREGEIFDKDGKDLTYNDNGVLYSQRSRNLVYAWDPDGKSDISNKPPGFFGYKFLESPNNSTDGVDNDDDGLVDESPFNDKGTYIDGVGTPLFTGIGDTVKYIATYGQPKARWSGDENGNWDPAKDDVGVDGILNPNAPDFGEGNGVPDQLIDPDGTWRGSEPNFGFRDVNESDQMGLKSFWALPFGNPNRPKNDILMYDKISSEMDTAGIALLYPVQGDNIFLYGSGPFHLHTGDRQRFSIALLMGSNLNDLILNSEVAQRVLEANYRFAQPPPKPRVVAVPGDGRVTLYWDTASEEGVDPLTNENDFEGYKIYRSQDYTFKDVYDVTDGNGIPFIGKALYDDKAQKEAQWHLPWTAAQQQLYAFGYHPAEYQGRAVKYYMGQPGDVSGIVHQYVDSTVTNGKTYYYAVVAFDHGVYNDSLKLPPTETQAIIQRDAVTQEFRFDVNTVAVVPGKYASGVVNPTSDIVASTNIQHSDGVGTGKISLQVMNPTLLENNVYTLRFTKTKVGADSAYVFSIYRDTPVVEHFVGRDTLFVSLKNINIVLNSVKVFSGTDTLGTPLNNASLVIDTAGGLIKATSIGVLKNNQAYTISYSYFPIIGSTNMKNQDANVVFDGIRPFVSDDILAVDNVRSFFSPSISSNISTTVTNPSLGVTKLAPLDIKIVFSSSTADTTINGDYIAPADSFGISNPAVRTVRTPFKILNGTESSPILALIKDTPAPGSKNGRWDIGEEITIITPPPYQTAASNTMMGILIKRIDNTQKDFIPANTTFTARMKKPFTEKDVFTFATKSLSYNAQFAVNNLDNVIVVPNPYVVSSQFELPSYRSDLRGERVLQFRNLPRECTIRIYTLTGELVQTLYKNDLKEYCEWDLKSSESARIAYGIYIYHVTTPDGGNKIGRIGIIK